MEDKEAQKSLQTRGFYVAAVGDTYGLYSNEGELRVQMKDGVCYVLRFGEIAAGTGSVDDKKKDSKKEGEEEDGEEAASGLNRYLFVMAEFNEDAIPKPDLEPLPLGKPENKPGGKTRGSRSRQARRRGADRCGRKAGRGQGRDGRREAGGRKGRRREARRGQAGGSKAGRSRGEARSRTGEEAGRG